MKKKIRESEITKENENNIINNNNKTNNDSNNTGNSTYNNSRNNRNNTYFEYFACFVGIGKEENKYFYFS